MTQAANNDASSFLFYCDLAELSREGHTAYVALITRLFGSLVEETRELDDGYAYRFDGEYYSLLVDCTLDIYLRLGYDSAQPPEI